MKRIKVFKLALIFGTLNMIITILGLLFPLFMSREEIEDSALHVIWLCMIGALSCTFLILTGIVTYDVYKEVIDEHEKK